MSEPSEHASGDWIHELEQRVAALFELNAEQQAEGFRALRAQHPDQADLLRRWEQSARIVSDVPPSAALGEGEWAGSRPRIGNYRLLRHLGEGGMGVVFLAERIGDRERVALKVVRQSLASGDILTRFEAEARALERLSHPNIASLVDSGKTEDDRPFFAMQYVPGLAIHEYCDRQQLDLRGRVGLLRQACLGVQHAHERGVLHRDLKPSNILVQIARGDAEPVIIDFGVARALEGRLADRTLCTEHGRLLGTPEYMSPEQAEMSALELNLRSDIYSLGVVLFELLTGELPFPSGEVRQAGRRGVAETLRRAEVSLPSARVAESLDTPTGSLRAQLRGTEPAELVRELHGGLDWIVMQCLEKDPARRYPTAQALADDLDRYLSGRPVVAGPPGLRRRCGRVLRRHRQTLYAAAAIAVFGGAAWFASRQDPAQQTPSATSRSVTRFDIPTAASPRGPLARRRIDFATDGLRAVHVVLGGEGASDSLAIWDQRLGHSRPVDAGLVGRWKLFAPRWDPAAERIAFVGSRQDRSLRWMRQVFVCSAAGGDAVPVLLTPADEPLIDVCWVPDGSGLLCADLRGPLFALGLDGARTALQSPGRGVGLGGTTADGRWLICSAVSGGTGKGTRDLWVVPLQGGAPRQITALPGNAEYPRLTSDESSVWFVHTIGRPYGIDAEANGTANIFSLPFDPNAGSTSGPVSQLSNYEGLELTELAFVHDGGDAVWRSRHRATAVHCRNGTAGTVALGHGTQAQVSAAGDLVCFLDGNLDRLAVVGCSPSARQPPTELASLERFERSGLRFRCRPDGRAAAVSGVDSAGPGVFLIEFGVGGGMSGSPTRIATTSTAVTSAWSPDGQRLAWCDAGRLWVHQVGTGATDEVGPQIFEWEPGSMSWSPDGMDLVATGYASAHDRDAHDANTVFAVHWPSRNVRALTPTGDPYKEQVTWHPSGGFLTAVYSHHAIGRIERDGSGTSLLLDDPDHQEYFGRWNSAGSRFVFQCLECRTSPDLGVHAYDLEAGQLVLDAQGARPYATRSLDGTVEAWTESSASEHFEWLRGVRD